MVCTYFLLLGSVDSPDEFSKEGIRSNVVAPRSDIQKHQYAVAFLVLRGPLTQVFNNGLGQGRTTGADGSGETAREKQRRDKRGLSLPFPFISRLGRGRLEAAIHDG